MFDQIESSSWARLHECYHELIIGFKLLCSQRFHIWYTCTSHQILKTFLCKVLRSMQGTEIFSAAKIESFIEKQMDIF